MTSVTIRDLRQKWPETEKALETEEEILITRDGKPVAKLIKYIQPIQKRRRFDPEKHLAKMRKILEGPSFAVQSKNGWQKAGRIGLNGDDLHR